MPSSTPRLKFLLDENIPAPLRSLLQSQKHNVKLVEKAISDKTIASISLKEKRILIRNTDIFVQKTTEGM